MEWSAPLAHKTPPVEIQNIDPRKLETIRRQWKDKSLLLDQDKSRPSEKEAPPDARYLSDRNIHVEKEQRAKETDVIPKPGHPNQPQSSAQTEKHSQPKHRAQTKPLPKLGNLGIPFSFDKKVDPSPKLAQNSPQNSQRNLSSFAPAGGDQAIPDKNLPTGSENLLNAQESVYYSFYARLYEAIGPIWQSRIRQVPYQRRVMPGEYRTSVDVVLDKNGNVLEIRKLQGSGIEEFDSAVDEAWKKVGRFPNPPEGLLDGERHVHTGWTFSVDVGQGFGAMSLPPERNY